MTEATLNRKYTAYGGATELFRSTELEVIAESGAGTGKTFSLLQKANQVARAYPGSKQIFARWSRKSMNDSVLPQWEEEVLWRGHPAITGTAGPAHREVYRYPNDSTITLHSLDNIERILSSQHDRIYVFQAEELTSPNEWEQLITRLRNGRTPYGQIIADVNPGAASHWLNQRADTKICTPCYTATIRDIPLVVEMNEDDGPPYCPECNGHAWQYQMHRIRYRHEDNPRWYDHEREEWTQDGKVYIGQVLGRLKGVRRERLLKHRWVAEDGVILDEWDPKTHLIDSELLPPGTDPDEPTAPHWRMKVKGWPKTVTLIWFGAGVDWGYFPDPGVISVWGYDEEGRRFLVAEVIKTRLQIDQWAEIADQLRELFKIKYFACDPSRPDHIEALNLRMTSRFHRHGPIAIKANNTLRSKAKGKGRDLVGIDLMRHGLRDEDGVVTTFVRRNCAVMGIDSTLKKAGRPTSTADEVLQWVYAKASDGRTMPLPDDKCDDHGLDAWRYEQSSGWLRKGSRMHPDRVYKPGSYGKQLWSTYKKD